jgi:hypothetical protein
VSIAANGADTQEIRAAVVVVAIGLLSLMPLLAPNATGTMCAEPPAHHPKGRIAMLGRTISIGVTCLAVSAAGIGVHAQRDTPKEENRRPKLTLKAQPNVGIAPARILLTAELTGGANDFEEYYCPTILWDWADGTESESTLDCDPYEAGKSEIKRRYTVQHTFRAGAHKVWVRLKRNDKAVASATVTLRIQPGRGIEDDH